MQYLSSNTVHRILKKTPEAVQRAANLAIQAHSAASTAFDVNPQEVAENQRLDELETILDGANITAEYDAIENYLNTKPRVVTSIIELFNIRKNRRGGEPVRYIPTIPTMIWFIYELMTDGIPSFEHTENYEDNASQEDKDAAIGLAANYTRGRIIESNAIWAAKELEKRVEQPPRAPGGVVPGGVPIPGGRKTTKRAKKSKKNNKKSRRGKKSNKKR
jgi:hypothetical protein